MEYSLEGFLSEVLSVVPEGFLGKSPVEVKGGYFRGLVAGFLGKKMVKLFG